LDNNSILESCLYKYENEGAIFICRQCRGMTTDTRKFLQDNNPKKQLDRREPGGTNILRRSIDILKNQKGELVDNMETERGENEKD
jgi:hypothetical protein